MSEASGTTPVGGSSKEKVQLHVKELGLTQIDGHIKDHDFIADVIFVHGLQGHPKRTWQSKSSTETHKSLCKRLQGLIISASKKRVHEDNGLFWPAELLPNDFKTTRIMTYGYDSKVTKAFKGPTSKNGIFQHGRSFLGALSRARVDCDNRPIIVVAHSLGYVPFGDLVLPHICRKRKVHYTPKLTHNIVLTHESLPTATYIMLPPR